MNFVQFASLPKLPRNAKYIQHRNECYDWGALGWLLLRSGKVNMSKFTYFVITNSSVRGPFLPSYIQVKQQSSGGTTSNLPRKRKLTAVVGSLVVSRNTPAMLSGALRVACIAHAAALQGCETCRTCHKLWRDILPRKRQQCAATKSPCAVLCYGHGQRCDRNIPERGADFRVPKKQMGRYLLWRARIFLGHSG